MKCSGFRISNANRLAFLLCLFLMSFQAWASQPVLLKKMTVHELPHHWRFTFYLSAPTKYRLFELNNPQRMILDLKNTSTVDKLRYKLLLGTPISNVRYSSHSDHILRVVFDMDSSIKAEVNELSAPNSKDHILQVNFIKPSREVAAFNWPSADDAEKANNKPDLLRTAELKPEGTDEDQSENQSVNSSEKPSLKSHEKKK